VNRAERALRGIAEDLDEIGAAPWTLVGGLAVSARSEPRFTRDVDVAVAVESDREAERLSFLLAQRGYRILASVEQEAQQRLATIRLACPGSGPRGVVLDLLFASSGIEQEVVSQADSLELLPGLVVPVATRAHLLALKVLAHDEDRPQDAADIRSLLERCGEEELEQARLALELVERRGFHRGKDLQGDFARAVARRTRR